MRLAHDVGALYVDTVAEPWPGFYGDALAVGLAALETTRCARACSTSSASSAPRTRPRLSCCGANPRHGVLVRQAGALERCGRSRPSMPARRTAARNGRGARAQGRRQGHPHRRARHPACRQAEADGHVRQHLVGRRFLSRRVCSRPSSAGGRTSGCSRRRGRRHEVRPRLRDLPDAPRAPAHACAHGARRPARSTVSWSRTTRRSRSPTI